MANNTPSRLPAEFLAERDARIFSLRKTGLSATDIARRLELSTAQVNGAITRQLGKLNRESFLAYPEVLRMELERLDSMQAAYWPKTQVRRVTLDDGSEVVLEADEKAGQMVMSIMTMRSKLLGMDIAAAAAHAEAGQAIDVRSTLEGAGAGTMSAEETRADEGKQMLAIAIESGMVPEELGAAMLASDTDDEIVDGEIIEEDPAQVALDI